MNKLKTHQKDEEVGSRMRKLPDRYNNYAYLTSQLTRRRRNDVIFSFYRRH